MVLFAALTTFFLLLRCTSAATPTDLGDETPYQVIPTGTDAPQATGTVSPENLIGTQLYGYVDCKKNFGGGAKGKIDDAYYDAWLLSNTEGVVSNIDWNNAAALEFLGAPATNKDQQSEIQAVFENTATVIYSNINPFPHWIKIRCDDPSNICPKSNQDDPCQSSSSKRDGQAKAKTTLLAYATNVDPDSPSYPMINLCEGFFTRRSLADAISFGNAYRYSSVQE